MKTDAQLQQDVIAELQWEPSVHATHIGVEVHCGVVTLGGHVASYSEKWSAELAAQRVSGIKALSTELKVELPGLSHRSDADIADAVENVLAWTAPLPNGAIQVMVEDGWVTLTGHVELQFQRQAATDSARHLMGVTGVSDQISLKPSDHVVVVKSDIEAALQRAGLAAVKTVTVVVHGPDVTLSGTCCSWEERESVKRSAWGTPGVRNVVDLMTLAH